MIEIRAATTEIDFNNVADCYHAFRDWLASTYPELVPISEPFFIELEAEIESFPGIYSPPRGSLLIATYNGAPAGTVALADLGQNHCELRRMFVNSQFRGARVGHALGQAIIDEARQRSYSKIRLSTLPRHYAALGLYRSLGFTFIDQVEEVLKMPENVPDDLEQGAIFMELKL